MFRGGISGADFVALRTGLLAFVVSVGMVFSAHGSPIEQGRMSVGVGLGGGSGAFSIGGEFGYFVLDGLRPSAQVQYNTVDVGTGTYSEFEAGAGLRYYIDVIVLPLYPFVGVEGASHQLTWEPDGGASQSYSHGRFGVEGGTLLMLGRRFGVELALGYDKLIGVDSNLLNDGVLDEEWVFRWGLGFALSL